MLPVATRGREGSTESMMIPWTTCASMLVRVAHAHTHHRSHWPKLRRKEKPWQPTCLSPSQLTNQKPKTKNKNVFRVFFFCRFNKRAHPFFPISDKAHLAVLWWGPSAPHAHAHFTNQPTITHSHVTWDPPSPWSKSSNGKGSASTTLLNQPLLFT